MKRGEGRGEGGIVNGGRLGSYHLTLVTIVLHPVYVMTSR